MKMEVGKGWSYIATSQGMDRVTRRWDSRKDSSYSLQMRCGLVDILNWTCSLQNWKRIYFCCFKVFGACTFQSKIGPLRENSCQWHHWPDGHEFQQLWEMVKDREGWRAAVHWVTKSQTRLSDWTTREKTTWIKSLKKNKNRFSHFHI